MNVYHMAYYKFQSLALTDDFFLPSVSEEYIKVFVLIIILLSDFNSFSIFFVKVADVKSICGVYFALGRDDGGRKSDFRSCIPIETGKECVRFNFFGATTLASQPLLRLALQHFAEQVLEFGRESVWKFDIHGKGEGVDRALLLALWGPERTSSETSCSLASYNYQD